MSRTIKYPCQNCSGPRWRHKEGNQLPSTCEKYKAPAKVKAEAPPVESTPAGFVAKVVESMESIPDNEPLKTGDA